MVRQNLHSSQCVDQNNTLVDLAGKKSDVTKTQLKTSPVVTKQLHSPARVSPHFLSFFLFSIFHFSHIPLCQCFQFSLYFASFLLDSGQQHPTDERGEKRHDQRRERKAAPPGRRLEKQHCPKEEETKQHQPTEEVGKAPLLKEGKGRKATPTQKRRKPSSTTQLKRRKGSSNQRR